MGQLGNGLTMGNIDATAKVQLDEEVFTAGIELAGGIRSPYPKGLLIGRVIDVKRDANDVVQTAFLLPAADLDSFESALIITDYEGGLRRSRSSRSRATAARVVSFRQARSRATRPPRAPPRRPPRRPSVRFRVRAARSRLPTAIARHRAL